MEYYENYASLVVDANKNTILFAHYPTKKINPGVLTKLMVIYVVLDAIDRGTVSPLDLVEIGKISLSTNRFSTGISEAKAMTVKDLLLRISVLGANDATFVLAQEIGNNVDQFVKMMNDAAAHIGMLNTHFSNIFGLKSDSHYSTAYDMALLMFALNKKFTPYWSIFGMKQLFSNGKIYFPLSDISDSFKGVDAFFGGLELSVGYSVFTSARHRESGVIAVAFGLADRQEGERYMVKILDFGIKKLLNGPDSPQYQDFLHHGSRNVDENFRLAKQNEYPNTRVAPLMHLHWKLLGWGMRDLFASAHDQKYYATSSLESFLSKHSEPPARINLEQ